eukprot:s5005_g2.t3
MTADILEMHKFKEFTCRHICRGSEANRLYVHRGRRMSRLQRGALVGRHLCAARPSFLTSAGPLCALGRNAGAGQARFLRRSTPGLSNAQAVEDLVTAFPGPAQGIEVVLEDLELPEFGGEELSEELLNLNEGFWGPYRDIPSMATATKKEEILQIVESFALVKRKHVGLFQRLTATVQRSPELWSAADFALLCRSLGEVGCLHEDLCVAMAPRVTATISSCEVNDLVLLLDAYARTRCHVPSAVEAILQQTALRLEEFSVSQLCLHVSSMARLNICNERLLTSIADKLAEVVFPEDESVLQLRPPFSARDITMAAYSFARLGLREHGVWSTLSRQQSHMEPSEISWKPPSVAILRNLSTHRSCAAMLRDTATTSETHPESEAEADYHLEDPKSLAAFLKHADIRLVRAEYLYELRSQRRLLPRRQEAEEWGLVSHEEVSNWAAGARDAMIISISHAWETREHPDPCGDQLNRLADRLSLYDAAYYSDIWLFYDYISLFQFERQTPAEEESFRRSMNHMHVLYAHDYNWTFRIEALTPQDVWDAALANSEHLVTVYDAASKTVRGRPLKELVANRVPYQGRGWCKAEVEWSSCRSRSEQNQPIDAPESQHDSKRARLQGKVPMAPEVFEEGMANAEFTHRNDATEVLKLQRKIFHQKVSECVELLLSDLPKGELGQLAKALTHYKKLKVLRPRNIEAGEEEAKEFAKALAVDNTITELEIKVADHARCSAVWKALAGALETNRTLTTIDLRDNDICGEGCKALGKALRTNGAITTIDLRQNGRILASGLKALAEALTANRTVSTINLDYNGSGYGFLWEIRKTLETRKAFKEPSLADTTSTQGYATANSAQAWAGRVRSEELLSLLQASYGSIATMECHFRTKIGEEGCKALGKSLKTNRTITKISLSSNGIGDEGSKAIAAALTTNRTLREIDLESNNIADEGCKALGDALATNRTLREIDLESNNIADEGCKAFAEALQINNAITKIILLRNRIGDEGSKALGRALKINCTITTVDLGMNHISDALADALATNCTLTDINLASNGITDEGCKALADALVTNCTLTDINLASNLMADEGCKAFAEALKSNASIESLRLERNRIGADGIKALADALQINCAISYISLQSQPFGDDGYKALEGMSHFNRAVEWKSTDDKAFIEISLGPCDVCLKLAPKPVMRHFTAKELQTVTVALARVQRVDAQLLDDISTQAQRRIAQFSAEPLALLLRGFAFLGRANDPLFTRALTQLPRVLLAARPADLVTHLAAFVAAEVRSPFLFDLMTPMILEKAPMFTAFDWLLALRSYAAAHQADEMFLSAFELHFKASELSKEERSEAEEMIRKLRARLCFDSE